MLTKAITACLLAAATAHAQPESPPPAPASIRGTVRAADDAPVPNTIVILCDAATGIPVRRTTWQPFTDTDGDILASAADIATTNTANTGTFAFDAVAPGRYRIVAQSWRDTPRARGPLDVNGTVVHLRGVTDTVDLEPGEFESVDIRPLGDATLVMADLAPNNETLVVVSLAPTTADPILGFAGWNGPFMRSAIGANRMPRGRTTLLGLPAGEVHVAIFSADNVPGWGAATVTLDEDRPTRLDLPFVVAWSDAVHSPPPDLEDLTDTIAAMSEADRIALMRRLGPEMRDAGSPLAAMAALGPRLDDPVELANGTRSTTGRVVAAIGYASLRAYVESRGRTPNPYRAPESRAARPDELPR